MKATKAFLPLMLLVVCSSVLSSEPASNKKKKTTQLAEAPLSNEPTDYVGTFINYGAKAVDYTNGAGKAILAIDSLKNARANGFKNISSSGELASRFLHFFCWARPKSELANKANNITDIAMGAHKAVTSKDFNGRFDGVGQVSRGLLHQEFYQIQNKQARGFLGAVNGANSMHNFHLKSVDYKSLNGLKNFATDSAEYHRTYTDVCSGLSEVVDMADTE